jgi:hypothetical protein
MTYIEIKRPSNGLVLARFSLLHNYWYRFDNDLQIPLAVSYGWCARCEEFVEVERLYSEEEIQQKLHDLDLTRSDWPVRDAAAREMAEILGQYQLKIRSRLMAYEAWNVALAWRRTRQSPPRCLKCSSCFAVTVLPEYEEVPHPHGKGSIILTSDGTLGGGPSLQPASYFDREGLQLFYTA